MDCTILAIAQPALWSVTTTGHVRGVSCNHLLPLSRRTCQSNWNSKARHHCIALGRGEASRAECHMYGPLNAGTCSAELLAGIVVASGRQDLQRRNYMGVGLHHMEGSSARDLHRKRKQIRHICLAAGGPVEREYVELPLFPLPLVLFPGAVLPLQIFEYRYRIMMHTLLETDLRFGVLYSGKEAGTAAAIGCVGEVIKHERLVDDRFFLVCRGQERFRVVSIVRTKPYLVGRVEWLEDKPSPEPADLEALASEVERLMKDVIRLSNKMTGKGEKDAPDDLRKRAFPTPFSFWVASTFEGASMEQQSLLELEDTAERLKRERDTLTNTLNYLTAATAVKDAFSD